MLVAGFTSIYMYAITELPILTNKRENLRYDRETSNSYIETCFCKNVFLRIIFKNLHLKSAFANFLLISFRFNFRFMFYICIIIIDLIFIDFRFYLFPLEICKIYMTSKYLFPSPISIKTLSCFKLDKSFV
jgi:hypothetical protein